MQIRWIWIFLMAYSCIESNPQPSPGAPGDGGWREADVGGGPGTADGLAQDTSASEPGDTSPDWVPEDVLPGDIQPACEPQCQGLECGDNGCGKVCGTCPDGWTCDEGLCACVPDCQGKECGKDGCGGTCGACPAGEACSEFAACFVQGDVAPWTGAVLKIITLEIAEGGTPGYALDLDNDPGTCAPVDNCVDGLDNAMGGLLKQVNSYIDMNEEYVKSLASGEEVLLAEFLGFNEEGVPFQMNMFRGHPVEPVEVCDVQSEVCEYSVDPAYYDVNTEPLWSFSNVVIHQGTLHAGGPSTTLKLSSKMLFGGDFPVESWVTANIATLEADPVILGGDLVGLENAVFGMALDHADILNAMDEISAGTGLPISPDLVGPGNPILIPDIDADMDGTPDSVSAGFRHKAISGFITGLTECTPDCQGKVCGPDNCGWVCGECANPYDACVNGQCGPCQPDCLGKVCGPDGCGGLCGICGSPDGADCVDGQCEDCVPNCMFSVCGPDGCQGTCGECLENQWCESGTCVWDPSPIPKIHCEEGTFGLPGTVLHLSGAQSESPNGDIVGWFWSVDGPAASVNAAAPLESLEEISFTIDAAGLYTFHLDVEDETGEDSFVVAHYQVEAVPSDGILVELVWHGLARQDGDAPVNGSDMDLHLLHPWAAGPDVDEDGLPDGWYDQPFDCFWFNPSPEWGTFDPEVKDNPILFIDDKDGEGPEGIKLEVPEERTYTVGVHYWNSYGYGAAEASVRVYLDGALAWESTPTWLGHWDMWRVCEIDMALENVGGVTNTEGEAHITPAYQHPYFLP